MKSLRLHLLYRQVAGVSFNKGIHTNNILLLRGNGGKIRPVSYEPGIKLRQNNVENIFEDQLNESELDSVVDFMNIDKSYDSHYKEVKDKKKRLDYVITAKKFFTTRPEPLTLTWNERRCITYLHQQDPVQWNIKTLSESFPASPQVIKKILKQKRKITPERAKILDEKVQKNWKLLEEGKLDADPKVLEHLRKFVNRRQIILEQIKNEKFYFPEIKKEPIWNNGEFSGVLAKYEKTIKMLLQETEEGQQPRMLEDGKPQDKDGKSTVDVIEEEIEEQVSRRRLEEKDSFIFQGLSKNFKDHVTLGELENQIMEKADARGELNIMEKAILEKKLGMITEKKIEKITENESLSSKRDFSKDKPQQVKKNDTYAIENNMKDRAVANSFSSNKDFKTRLRKLKHVEEETSLVANYLIPDDRTKWVGEYEVGKLLSSLNNSKEDEPKNSKIKKEIDFSDPERLERENKYYDKEVLSIKGTAFWNTGENSKDRANAELQKHPHDGPAMTNPGVNLAKTATLSTEQYPERIKIPMHQRRSGLTFRIKDCYYDDDGMFLYRVPGMTK